MSVSQYKTSLIDILDNFISNLAFPVQIWNVIVGNGSNGYPVGQYCLSVDNVYHAVVGYTVTINAKPYTIVSWIDTPGAMRLVVQDPASSGAISPQQQFNFYPVFFFHGTPLDSTTEIKEIKNEFEKSPMVWLWENYTETFHDDPEDAIERESEVSLYFLTITNQSQKQQTDDLDTNYIRPMRRLLDNFISALGYPFSQVQRWGMRYKVENYYKFGIIARNKGVQDNLMTDKVSGCELKITLKIYKPQPVGGACNSY